MLCTSSRDYSIVFISLPGDVPIIVIPHMVPCIQDTTPAKTLLITFLLKSMLDFTDFHKWVHKDFSYMLANTFNQHRIIVNHKKDTNIMKIYPQMPKI